MSTNNLKQQICDALAAWIRQRPGLEAGYFGVAAYRTEQRRIARDKRDAETLLQAVRWRDSITADMLREAFKRSFSGRLTLLVPGDKCCNRCKRPMAGNTAYDGACECGGLIEAATVGNTVKLDYCTGQYWPTEYRKAAAAVLAGALWAHARDAANGFGAGFKASAGREPDGNELRDIFRREFGSKIQRRWFN